MKNKMIRAVIVTGLIGALSLQAYASLSISDLHGNQNELEISAVSGEPDDTNTAEVLSQCDIYTNEAIVEQYKEEDEFGKLQDTPLSVMVEEASGAVAETGANGKSIVEEIPSVSEMIEAYCEAVQVENKQDAEIDLRSLDQLTYLLDFKYASTDYRVVAGERVTTLRDAVKLDNGMFSARLRGGEIIRSAQPEKYVIVQIDPQTNEVYYLTMKDYDEKTGDFTVEFPCVGPYMITQIMDRE